MASEIRAFDSSGTYLHKVAAKGEGPGELGEANGMILVGDTILWVQDHSKWTMIGLSPDGEELARFPMHVLSHGYIWTGTVDNLGRFWKPDAWFGKGGRYEPKDGVNEIAMRLYYKSFDTSTNTVDSVYMGDDVGMNFVQSFGTSRAHYGIPFRATRMSAVDPDGGFWQVYTSTYRVARLDQKGDTVLVVEVAMDPVPVGSDERATHIERITERGQRFQRAAEAVASLIPETKPLIQKLIVDDRGRLWVEREVDAGANPVYDVFDRAGEFWGSIKLDFKPDQFRPIRVRHGHIYAVVLDEWDVPSIVRADLPDVLR
ncbi:MAG: hypothetical protein HKO65_06130 [Gemmatimonadetes bacterium]|nr:hypothetical protein [Gemmatimonadota bacterium]